ncbi:unnamed protein product [Meganyctiphanes norvegica]|uniref:C2H2-type domain-containing protein n=1 Tax=Meganyctiphanes norvegica TaxID=48144 RepID=A0AAV2RI00_MEGNR
MELDTMIKEGFDGEEQNYTIKDSEIKQENELNIGPNVSVYCQVFEKSFIQDDKSNIIPKNESEIYEEPIMTQDGGRTVKEEIEKHDGTFESKVNIDYVNNPYQGSHCGQAFLQNGAHSTEKPFHCRHCDNSFSLKHHLKEHLNAHTGETSYQCSHCDKTFSHSWVLTKHLRTHIGEKTYKCSHCDKDFSHTRNLIKHMRTHTGEKPYQRSPCDIGKGASVNADAPADSSHPLSSAPLSPNGILKNPDTIVISTPLSPLEEKHEYLGWDPDSAGEDPGDDESVGDPDDPLEDIEEINNANHNPETPVTDSFIWEDCVDFDAELFFSHWDQQPSGITGEFPVGENGKEIDFWEALLSDDILSKMAAETNKYVLYVKENNQIYPHSRINAWKPTNVRELKVFFALLFLMPLNMKHVIGDYWKNDPLIPTPLWGKYMQRDRFLLLFSMLHFADNNCPSDTDCLWKVREIFEMFTANFQKYFVPFQKIVIVETNSLFKGKIFVLCDCETRIILDMIVYTGTNNDCKTNDPLGISGVIVKKITEPYMDKGHILYTDHWFSSPGLCQYLLTRKTGSVGTVKKNRKDFPKFPETERGAVTMKRSGCGKIIALCLNEQKPVYMVSTVNSGVLKDIGKKNLLTQEPILRPEVFLDYNRNIRLIGKSDCQLSEVESVRQCGKWYHKFMFHILDVNNRNAYNFFLVKTGRKEVKLREFIYNLVQQILAKYGELTTHERGKRAVDLPDRASAIGFAMRHYPENFPEKEYSSGRRKLQRPCYVCTHTNRKPSKKVMVTTKCNECDVALCLGTCFRDYHVVPNLDDL